MKRILLPAGGAALATGLLAAGLAGTAQAAPDWATDPLAAKKQDAYSVAQFWLDANGEALKKATAYYWDSKDVTKLVSGGGYTPDGKPGLAGLAAPAKAAKVKNINFPKTIGKVFFVNSKGEYKWCSATSIQSKYKNLVSTAGHCVYDIDGNKDVMDKWVFVPGYYQGKAPWGVYVGKQAFTHYDFDNYEDFDRDYAFVTVYNGISLGGKKAVKKDEYDKWVGDRWAEDVEITEAEYKKCKDLHGGETPDCWAKADTISDQVGPSYPGAVKVLKEVTKDEYDKAPWGKKNGAKSPKATTVEHVTESEYKAYTGPGYRKLDKKGNYTITHYFVKYWVKETAKVTYFKTVFYIGLVKDRGTLGSNVGGQGFAWNQKTGQPTWVFGYPAAAHPDGNKAYTGVTPKWCYNKKPSGKTWTASAYKVEEHIALKCAMTGGSDGSPWLIKYSNAKRLGYVNGVTSLFHDQDGNDRVDYVSSAYFDGETAAIYAKASNLWSGKIVGPKGEILK